MRNALLVLTVLLCGGPAFGQQWGDLKVKFVYDGTPPTPSPVNVTKDVEYCGKFGLVDETVVVNKENRGVANVVAYLRTTGGPEPAIHPDCEKAASTKIELDNIKCRFEPRVAVVWTKQGLLLRNSDSVGHNVKMDLIRNGSSNDLIPAGGMLEKQLSAAEPLPMPVACNIHPWMKGYLVVQETPYAAVSDTNGELLIKNIPVGKWTFQLWHETGYVANVTLDGKPTEWRRGRVEVEIRPGTNDLGEVKFKPTP